MSNLSRNPSRPTRRLGKPDLHHAGFAGFAKGPVMSLVMLGEAKGHLQQADGLFGHVFEGAFGWDSDWSGGSLSELVELFWL